jgi:hypothetical protein
MTRDEVRIWLVRFLLRRVRADRYPSTTQLDLIEEIIPCHMLDEYLRVLVDKVDDDYYPSIPLLYRMARVIDCLSPRHTYGDLDDSGDRDEHQAADGEDEDHDEAEPVPESARS